MKAQLKLFIAILAISTAISGAAMAACSISGTIEASPNPDPLGPGWIYTVEIAWDTGSQFALSHMGLWLDVAGGTCSCQDFQQAIAYEPIVGTSFGGCAVDYAAELNCQGDPSIPGVQGIVWKLEPVAGGCEPGTSGQGTFVFTSNLGPAPIDEDALTLVDKFARHYCFGSLTGDFPAMACNPVGADAACWGAVKSLFR